MAQGRKTGGRQKGTPNKVTKDLRDAIGGALDEVGGQTYLVKIANEHPQVFCALLGKIVPTETKHGGDPNAPIRIVVETGVNRT